MEFYKGHETHEQSFDGGMNSDVAGEKVPRNQVRYFLNCRVSNSGGNIGIVTNIPGNVMITTPLPAGTCQSIGSAADEDNQKFYFAVYNSNGYHTWYVYDENTNKVGIVMQNLTDTGGIDILRWNPAYPLLHIDIVDGKKYWVDGLNNACKYNIAKVSDRTNTGYGPVITEDFIRAYKRTSSYAPIGKYTTDTSRNSNNLYGNLFKFAIRFRYDDGELSNWSDWSRVPLPDNQSFLGIGNITFDNNTIELSVETGNRLVVKIEVAVKVNNTENVAGEIQSTDWVICQILDKAELSISDNSNYVWKFYNDGSYSTTDQAKVVRPFSFMGRRQQCQSFARNAMTYTNFDEGFPVVPIDASVAIKYLDLYIPSETVNKLNNPAFTSTFLGLEVSTTIPYSSTTRFLIGNDVKKGNVFSISTTNVHTYHFFFSYTAIISDTPTTVAAQIKAFLNTISPFPKKIYNENIDGSGNAVFDFDVSFGPAIGRPRFDSSVTPVSFDSLKDSGVSINIIPYGSVRNYAFVYGDEDSVESNGYTTPICVIRTPYITEIGAYKQPLHEITINHKPPIWAKYWRLVRTEDQPGLWLLIQAAIDVITTVDGLYTDLVVGSLFTYQKIHPNSELAYEFNRGDRIRFIADENTSPGVLYTQYYDTEILSYLPVTTEVINSNILVDGSASVKPEAAVNADYVGKSILINGYERLIVSVDIGTGKYNLDQKIVGSETGAPTTAVTFPNYTFIDRRGIIRIKRPDNGFELTTNILVEVYTPQETLVSADYRIFKDFGKKYDILNWGTEDRAHAGDTQNQTDSLPAIVQTTNGDAYIRNREYPTNNSIPGTQVVIDKAVDTNFSDFYASDLHDTGRSYPQDTGIGQKRFGSRTRYSNNYIQETSINGLNDFDNSSREDYNDTFGDVRRTIFKNSRIYLFKPLKTQYIPVNHTLSTDGDGVVLNVATEHLLNQLHELDWPGGIGNNPESVISHGNYIYLASTNSGVFLRIAADGSDAISTIYFFDTDARALLAIIQKYNLKLPAGYDRANDEVLWTQPQYIPYLFNGGFSPLDWSTLNDVTPAGTTAVIVTSPAHGTVTYDVDSNLFTYVPTTGYLGSDFFTYKLVLPGGAFTAIKKECITVVEVLNRQIGYSAKESSFYCLQADSPPDPPADSSLTVNNTTDGFTIAFVSISGGFPNLTSIGPGTSQSEVIDPGGYSVHVKVLSGTGTAGLHINGNTFPVSSSGTDISLGSISAPINVQLS